MKINTTLHKSKAKPKDDNTASEVPDTPFPLPTNYIEMNDFFINDGIGEGEGTGVIGGTLYINENDTSSEFYVWIYEESLRFDNYSDWENAMIAAGNPIN